VCASFVPVCVPVPVPDHRRFQCRRYPVPVLEAPVASRSYGQPGSPSQPKAPVEAPVPQSGKGLAGGGPAVKR
jgi:hypothetical protein